MNELRELVSAVMDRIILLANLGSSLSFDK